MPASASSPEPSPLASRLSVGPRSSASSISPRSSLACCLELLADGVELGLGPRPLDAGRRPASSPAAWRGAAFSAGRGARLGAGSGALAGALAASRRLPAGRLRGVPPGAGAGGASRSGRRRPSSACAVAAAGRPCWAPLRPAPSPAAAWLGDAARRPWSRPWPVPCCPGRLAGPRPAAVLAGASTFFAGARWAAFFAGGGLLGRGLAGLLRGRAFVAGARPSSRAPWPAFFAGGRSRLLGRGLLAGAAAFFAGALAAAFLAGALAAFLAGFGACLLGRGLLAGALAAFFAGGFGAAFLTGAFLTGLAAAFLAAAFFAGGLGRSLLGRASAAVLAAAFFAGAFAALRRGLAAWPEPSRRLFAAWAAGFAGALGRRLRRRLRGWLRGRGLAGLCGGLHGSCFLRGCRAGRGGRVPQDAGGRRVPGSTGGPGRARRGARRRGSRAALSLGLRWSRSRHRRLERSAAMTPPVPRQDPSRDHEPAEDTSGVRKRQRHHAAPGPTTAGPLLRGVRNKGQRPAAANSPAHSAHQPLSRDACCRRDLNTRSPAYRASAGAGRRGTLCAEGGDAETARDAGPAAPVGSADVAMTGTSSAERSTERPGDGASPGACTA